MKKLGIRPDELVVESFPTAAVAREAGTVRANENTGFYTCPGQRDTCNGLLTCADGCTLGLC